MTSQRWISTIAVALCEVWASTHHCAVADDIFVSWRGSDATGNGSKAAPYRTVGAAMLALGTVPDGDHRRTDDDILIERGGDYPPFSVNRDGWPHDRLRIAAYGDGPAPRIVAAMSEAGGNVIEIAGASRQHIEIEGLEIVGDLRGSGIRAIGAVESGHEDIVILRCRITACRDGLNIQRSRRVSIVECAIEANHGTAQERSQGAYFEDRDRLTINNCLVAYNGWDPLNPETRTIFNHGVYIRQRQWIVSNINVSGCTFVDNSSWGLTISTDSEPVDGEPVIRWSVITANAFIGGANGFVHGAQHPMAIADSTIAHNVFMRLGAAPSGVPQAHAIELKGLLRGTVTGNIIMAPAPLPDTAPRRAIIADRVPTPIGTVIAGNTIAEGW